MKIPCFVADFLAEPFQTNLDRPRFGGGPSDRSMISPNFEASQPVGRVVNPQGTSISRRQELTSAHGPPDQALLNSLVSPCFVVSV